MSDLLKGANFSDLSETVRVKEEELESEKSAGEEDVEEEETGDIGEKEVSDWRRRRIVIGEEVLSEEEVEMVCARRECGHLGCPYRTVERIPTHELVIPDLELHERQGHEERRGRQNVLMKERYIPTWAYTISGVEGSEDHFNL